MSWSVTFNDLAGHDGPALSYITADQAEYIGSQHPEYLTDLDLAFGVAKALGLKSAVLTGFRTPSPYNDDEVVEVSVRGMNTATDFNEAMKNIIAAGPDVSEGE